MKKSERYTVAMMAVLDSNDISSECKLEIIETLMEKRDVAVWNEKQEDEKA